MPDSRAPTHANEAARGPPAFRRTEHLGRGLWFQACTGRKRRYQGGTPCE